MKSAVRCEDGDVPDVVHDDAAGESLDATGDGHVVRLEVVVALEHVRRRLVLRDI